MRFCQKCKKDKQTSDFYKNHNSYRSECKSCSKEKHHKYYLENREYVLLRVKRYSEKIPQEKKHEYNQKYYKRNAEKKKAYALDWKKKNMEKVLIHSANRRAKYNGKITLKEWHALCEKFENKCVCCGEKKKLTKDHIIPISCGGKNVIENIQPLCQSCNSLKGKRSDDYRPAAFVAD